MSETVKIIKQIIVHDNCYFEVWTQEEDHKRIFNYKKLTNFYVNFLTEIINFNDKGEPLSSLEVEIIKSNGEKSPTFPLESSSKQDIQEFVRATSSKGTYASLLNSTHLAIIIDKLETLEKIYCYNTTGLITNGIKANSKFWLYSNCLVDMKTGELHKANNNGIIQIQDYKIKPDIKARKASSLKLSCQNKLSAEEIAYKLVENLLKAYNNSIEPFLIIGTALLAPFRDLLKTKTGEGFPVCYLYGSAKSGKTNLAKLICHLYGFNESYITSGTSTDNAIMDELGKSSRIPVIVDEYPIRNKFEDLLKSIYECSSRELMKRNGIDKVTKPINATAVFISNYGPPDNEQVMSRLNFTTFNRKNFSPEEARKFNELRDNALCFLLPAFLAFPETKIIEAFEDCHLIIKELNSTISAREINNLSIAYTGIMLLLEVAKWKNVNTIQTLINDRVQNFNEYSKTETSLDLLTAYLTTLKNNGKLEYNKDYKFTNEGKLALYLSDSLLNAFAKEYKLVTGVTAPNKKDILNSAKNDVRVDQRDEKATKTVDMNGIKKKCLVIDISENEELLDLKQNFSSYGAF